MERAVVERKVGVASGGGMRLKARLSHPPGCGNLPPGAPPSHDREKLSRGRIGEGYGAGGG